MQGYPKDDDLPFWRQVKPFPGGKISIELMNDKASFLAGSTIQGSVNLHLTEPCFEAKRLTIEIGGSEITRFRYMHAPVQGKSHIIKQTFTLQEFLDGSPQAGMYSYPFSIQLPSSMPPNMFL